MVLLVLTECVCEIATNFNDHSKLMKLMQYLNGLDDVYNQVNIHILLMKPLPNVKTAFYIIYREESRQKNGSLISGSTSKTQASIFNKSVTDFKRVQIKVGLGVKGYNENVVVLKVI